MTLYGEYKKQSYLLEITVCSQGGHPSSFTWACTLPLPQPHLLHVQHDPCAHSLLVFINLLWDPLPFCVSPFSNPSGQNLCSVSFMTNSFFFFQDQFVCLNSSNQCVILGGQSLYLIKLIGENYFLLILEKKEYYHLIEYIAGLDIVLRGMLNHHQNVSLFLPSGLCNMILSPPFVLTPKLGQGRDVAWVAWSQGWST